MFTADGGFMLIQGKIDISTILDTYPISHRQWLIVFLGFLVLGIDGFDVTAIGFIAPAIVDDWQISRHMLGPVMMSGLLGLAGGSLISGPLADRYGRRKIIIASVIFFGICSLLSAWSWDLYSLTFFRFITGLGLGAAMPNITTLVAEYAPGKYRSRLSTVIHCGFNTGAALGGLLSQQLLETSSWRSVLIIGGILPLLLALILLRYLPESMLFLVQSPQNKNKLMRLLNKFIPGIANEHSSFFTTEPEKSHANTAKSLLSSPYTLGTFSLWLTLFGGLFCVYLLSGWLPLMIKDAGLTLSQAVIIGSVFQVGGMMGNFCIGIEMDRWGQHCAIILTLLGGACCALILGLYTPSMPLLCVMVLLLGYTINGISPGCYALAAHFYPTSIRATGVSWATGVGRLGAITSAGVGSAMLAAGWTFNEVFMFLPLPLLIGTLALYCKKRCQVIVKNQTPSSMVDLPLYFQTSVIT
ncbi:MFS transporter [Escherichia albertii]|uniref:MFS transporter n=1 Tax=Escherichia albertii TaxID=208962 RepID=UPI00235E3569|nr:aromatic acid/H+ symport family MFS transporter [Escherichia albertii]WDC19238.1 aromatic acid/H+ symport family MFS transporter [Escherichia albertii]